MLDLAVGRDDIDYAEERHQRYADDPEQQLFPEIQRLHEAHLRSEPDAREMLLAVGMRYELQQHMKHFIVFPRVRNALYFWTRKQVPKRYERCSSWGCCYEVINALRLFHFTTDRR